MCRLRGKRNPGVPYSVCTRRSTSSWSRPQEPVLHVYVSKTRTALLSALYTAYTHSTCAMSIERYASHVSQPAERHHRSGRPSAASVPILAELWDAPERPPLRANPSLSACSRFPPSHNPIASLFVNLIPRPLILYPLRDRPAPAFFCTK